MKGVETESIEYRTEELRLEITEELCRVMKLQGVSRADVARRIGIVSKGQVSVWLNHGNMGIATIARFCKALDVRVKVRMQ